jgi:hypothetical protein
LGEGLVHIFVASVQTRRLLANQELIEFEIENHSTVRT